MRLVKKAYIVQWIAKSKDYESIQTRVMITTDRDKIFQKYPDLKEKDVNEIHNGYRAATVETI